MQPGQHGLGVRASGDRVGQPGAEPVEDADPQQQLLRPGVLPSEHLGQQEVGDGAAVGLELLEAEFRVGGLLRRERAQPQSGGPPAGPFHDPAHGGRGQPQAVRLHQPGRLAGREGELRVADLGQLARGPVAVQGQQRLGAGDEDQPQPGHGVAQQEVELCGDLGGGDPVELVKDQHHRPVPCAEQGGEPGRQGVAHPVRVGRGGDVAGQRHAGRAQRLEEVRPEHAGALPVGVGGEPGDGQLGVPGHPVRDQQRLPGAGAAVHHGQGCAGHRRGAGPAAPCAGTCPAARGRRSGCAGRGRRAGRTARSAHRGGPRPGGRRPGVRLSRHSPPLSGRACFQHPSSRAGRRAEAAASVSVAV